MKGYFFILILLVALISSANDETQKSRIKAPRNQGCSFEALVGRVSYARDSVERLDNVYRSLEMIVEQMDDWIKEQGPYGAPSNPALVEKNFEAQLTAEIRKWALRSVLSSYFKDPTEITLKRVRLLPSLVADQQTCINQFRLAGLEPNWSAQEDAPLPQPTAELAARLNSGEMKVFSKALALCENPEGIPERFVRFLRLYLNAIVSGELRHPHYQFRSFTKNIAEFQKNN